MTLNTLKGNHLTPLGLKGLTARTEPDFQFHLIHQSNNSSDIFTDKHVTIFLPSFVRLSVHVDSDLVNWRQIAAETQTMSTGIPPSFTKMLHVTQ